MESTTSIGITRVTDHPEHLEDIVAVEEPLEIRLRWGSETRKVSITMRTPGQDEDLALGFLFTEGVITHYQDVVKVQPMMGGGDVIEVYLKDGAFPRLSGMDRNFYTTSSCGVCGKASLDAVRSVSPFKGAMDNLTINASILTTLPSLLRTHQSVFNQTGGLHASGLFSTEGKLIRICEDVGRHNALDKLIGAHLKEGLLPLKQHLLVLSGRISFELVQKAVMAGIPLIAAIGAPSSLAIHMAREEGVTLAGFLRDQHFNIYTHPHRIHV